MNDIECIELLLDSGTGILEAMDAAGLDCDCTPLRVVVEPEADRAG
ncbi:hypothetical protein [Lysobacter sp. A3-1-A15]